MHGHCVAPPAINQNQLLAFVPIAGVKPSRPVAQQLGYGSLGTHHPYAGAQNRVFLCTFVNQKFPQPLSGSHPCQHLACSFFGRMGVAIRKQANERSNLFSPCKGLMPCF